MSEAIPTATLLDELEKRIDRRKVLAALFTTFEFAPDFFEEQILPVLFDQSFSNVSRVKRVQLEEALTAGPPIAVYFDARRPPRQDEDTIGPGLDFRKIPVVRNGYFHPKVFLILLERPATEDEPAERSLLVGVGSANLTRSGWWENVEAFWIDEIASGEKVRYRKDLGQFLKQLLSEGRLGDDHEALNAIKAYVGREVDSFELRSWGGAFEPRLFFGQSDFATFLAGELRLPPETYNLEILSPYFETGGARALTELVDGLRPRAVRVLEPQPDEPGSAADEGFLEAVAALGARVRWGQLPEQHLRRGKSKGEDTSRRFVHAKVYRLWSQSEGREIIAIGSANLTQAAHGRVKAGNFEAVVVFEHQSESGRRLQFWLNESEESPTAMPTGADKTEDAPAPQLALRYHWHRRVAEYHWLAGAAPPEGFEVLGAIPQPLARVPHVRVGEWSPLEADLERLEAELKSSAIVRVRVGGEEAMVLVAEEGLAHRPSILLSLTVEEILRYWSLLTPEQREVVIGTKIDLGVDSSVFEAHRSLPLATAESLFDRFAGIFHAFSRLREHVEKAITEGRPREAEARLLGARYDSLPGLIEKVRQGERVESELSAPDAQGDLVNRYVTLLCARQLLRGVLDAEDKATRAFLEGRVRGIRRLCSDLEDLSELEDRLELGSPEERRRFLDWFAPHFLREAEPVEPR